MTLFKTYKSKPIKRKAYEIQPNDKIDYNPETSGCVVWNDAMRMTFAAHEPVKHGDFVVFLNDNDIYHCNRKVFLERNEYPAEEA